MIVESNGYDLANEVFHNIVKNNNHEISMEDMIRVISFWGFNKEAPKSGRIGFVCDCATNKMEKILEKALMFNDFTMFNQLVKNMRKLEIGEWRCR